MNILKIITEIFSNLTLVTAISAMVLAQAIKILYYAITEKELNWYHFYRVGGMPSSHSALVSSLSMMVGLSLGFDSIPFSISTILSIVVMYDVIKVRAEEIAHTMVEAFSGMIFGIIVALISYNIWH